jgi:hypothetical protein
MEAGGREGCGEGKAGASVTTMRQLVAKHAPDAPRRSKFGNRKTMLDGMMFDSAAEAKDWSELKLRERAGEIKNLRRQVTFKCEWNGVLVTTYRADFAFDEYRDGHWHPIVADTKGFETALFRLKSKIMLAAHNVEIRLLKHRR